MMKSSNQENDSVTVKLNRSQALIQIINAGTTYCLWPRAGGKTGGGIGPRIQRLSEVMPRSQILLVSDTYERLETRVVPNIINFITDKLGLIEGVDFVKYQKPPDQWTKPLIPLGRFSRVISFATGMALCLVSIKVEGSANAFNAQAMICDETKYCDPKKIDTEVVPALRGAEQHFGHLPEYLSKWFFTDKYLDEAGDIKWLLNKRKLVDHEAVEVVYVLQMEIFNMQKELQQVEEKSAKYYALKKKIITYEQRANAIRKELIYVSEAQPYENKDVLGDFYYRSQKRNCGRIEYNVAILNEDPGEILNVFYPTLDNAHKYKMLNDVDPALPLGIALDYQWRISPMAIGQFGSLPGTHINTLNIVAGVHTLHEDKGGLEATCKAFSDLFATHQNKTVYYFYDHTAIGRTGSITNKPFRQIVYDELTFLGWTVIEVYIGKASDHNIRFERFKKVLAQTGEESVMFNDLRAATLLTAMHQAGAITSGGVTKKDKSKEKNLNYPAEEQTDYTEALDMLLWGHLHFNELRLALSGQVLGGISIR
ncbi:hypothetical protein QTN47_17500 [Danxiaibacter flavus]|uniref:Uncharacterized protein n=1 Tax=Danxiaibacter flavus TaxID=3049108 RepID=A0ABV3ZJJ2_9BACT|nr:hypothetical protein QNM32_17510 [Chitinophagaceae bacterium DXS]